MKVLLCLAVAGMLSGCLPVGIRAQNMPLAGQPSTQVHAAQSAHATS
jgi:hypothetical protein